MKNEHLPGVKTYPPVYIAKHHGVPLNQILNQLEMGIKIEMEHTDDEDVAKEIALDHLLELPDYYDKLQKVEECEIIDIRRRAGILK